MLKPRTCVTRLRRSVPRLSVLLTLACASALMMAVCQVQYMLRKSSTRLLSEVAEYAATAGRATAGLQKLSAAACDSAPDRVNRLAAFTPGVRSVGWEVNGTVTCSSVTGHRAVSFIRTYGVTLPDGAVSLRTTPVLPGRAVILYGHYPPSGPAEFVVMDAGALLATLSGEGGGARLHYVLRVGAGDTLTGGRPGRALPGFSRGTLQGRVSLTVSAPASAVLWRAAHNLPVTVPLVALGGVLMSRGRARRQRGALLSGMRRGEFSACYQPVCETQSGRCVGAEVLMRWTRANGDSVSPEAFIAAAEREGVIIPLTRHLFTLIEKDFTAWTVQAGFRLAVNVAGSHLLDPDFLREADALMAVLKARGMTGVVEITERSLVPERAPTVLSRLRDAGFKVMLDDFGTGYSSLSCLQALPVDGIKIDRCFTEGLSAPGAGTPVLDAIISLGHRLGLEIVAEGVSEDAQRHGLLQRGVGLSQGYLYARPMDGGTFAAWITRRPVE